MAIRKTYLQYYGAKWRKARLSALQQSDGKCEHCGCEHKWLNWCHLSHDPKQPVNMAFLCPSCHAKHDAKQRYAMTRRTRSTRSKQLWLDPMVKYAPYPVRLWPDSLRQMKMFP